MVPKFHDAAKDSISSSLLNCFIVQRVCNAEYHIPSDVEIAPEFEELLRGMLQPDWQRRMTVKEILHHPWFAEGLPPGVVDMNARLPDGPSPSHGQVTTQAAFVLYRCSRHRGMLAFVASESANLRLLLIRCQVKLLSCI